MFYGFTFVGKGFFATVSGIIDIVVVKTESGNDTILLS